MKSIGYVIDHANKTITITKAFQMKANKPGTKEFRELAQLHKAYPDYDIIRRTANVDKEKKQTHSGLTIDRMEKYIKVIEKDNEENALKSFNAAKEFYEGERAYYGKMKSWFLKKYPNYADVEIAA